MSQKKYTHTKNLYLHAIGSELLEMLISFESSEKCLWRMNDLVAGSVYRPAKHVLKIVFMS